MKILLADKSEILTMALKSQLERTHDVRVCHDGVSAAQMLFEDCPDLLLLDMSLPGLDGFAILQTLRDSSRCVPVIALSNELSDFERNWLRSLGVECLLLKPCAICQVMLRIHAVLGNIDSNDIATTSERILLALGLRMNLLGFDYIDCAIKMLAENPSLTLTKELYPAVAAFFGVTSQSVERSIRTAIHDAWSRRNEAVWRMYFSCNRDENIPCPNNSTFLVRLSRCLHRSEIKIG